MHLHVARLRQEPCTTAIIQLFCCCFSTLPGPRGWAVWLILVPQLFVAVTAFAGLAGGAATALILVLPGPPFLWMTCRYSRRRHSWPLAAMPSSNEPRRLLLKMAGAIEAAHIPVVAALTLYLNRTQLPSGLQPSPLTVTLTIVAAAFFAAFAGYYVWTLISG